MGKLFDLKEWLTVAEAARHLATLFEEEVTEADVLRLALDGRLRLSVNFVNHAIARRGKVIPLSEARTAPGLFTREGEEPYEVVLAININDRDFLELEEIIQHLTGVWDLPMIGGEGLDVEHAYQQLTGGPAVTLTNLEGAFVQRAYEGIYQLQASYDDNEYQAGSSAALDRLKQHIADKNIGAAEAEALLTQHKEARKKFLEKRKANMDSGKNSNNYHPAAGLPEDSVLVVRTAALREFQDVISGAVDFPHPLGLNVVPRQSLVDEEVIAYWKQKRSISSDEIAALVCGINPFAWEAWKESVRTFPPDNKNREIVSAEKKQEIEEILILLHDRIDPFEGSCSLMEWKSLLILYGIPMPEWLKNLHSKAIQRAIENMRRPGFQEEMAQRLNAIEARHGIPFLLSKWFLHDTWSAQEGLLLLVGLDPSRMIIGQTKGISGETFDEFEYAYTLDSFEVPPRSFVEKEGGNDISKMDLFRAHWKHLNEIWNSGSHSGRNAPAYYLAWAASKGYSVAWLDWAKAQGLLKVGQESIQEQKPMATKERSTLLTIIAVLAKEAKIDWQKTSKAAELIVSAADQDGLSLGQRTVEEHLKRIPDALERKGKT